MFAGIQNTDMHGYEEAQRIPPPPQVKLVKAADDNGNMFCVMNFPSKSMWHNLIQAQQTQTLKLYPAAPPIGVSGWRGERAGGFSQPVDS